ncbi:MAG: hypothetical protein E6915_09075 [Streptococcus mitis]|uniref:hypothetical protein n=1 Tax=Streptococcus mitis TaxID=28037 RepID=UPI0021B4FB09|nr:hypothetical protein [Streptococcus mitis]MDU1406094.1 hypothetical protein [Streptococcus mitis]
MVEYEKHQLIVNGKVIKSFKFGIRNVIEHGDAFIVLLEVSFDNESEKSNILRIDASGNVVWTINNSGYSNNSYPFEQMTLSDGWLYATDFYGRRLKVDIKTGKIVDLTLSK